MGPMLSGVSHAFNIGLPTYVMIVIIGIGLEWDARLKQTASSNAAVIFRRASFRGLF